MSVVANVAVNLVARNAVSDLEKLKRKTNETKTAFDQLKGAVATLGASLAAVGTVKFIFGKTAELETQARSLQVLTGSAETATGIIKELQAIGNVTPFTSTELIDAAKKLSAFGIETERVVETTKRLADISGASGAELQGLTRAFGQVIAKGRLQGEELLQFQERGVALQKQLRKQYNLSADEFQTALRKGQISAEAVEFAVKKLTDAGGKYADGAIAQSDTLNGKFSTLIDTVDRLARTIGTILAPAFKAILDLGIKVVGQIESAIFAATNPGAVSARRDIESGLLPLNVQGAAELFRGTGPNGGGLKELQDFSTQLAQLQGRDRKEVLLELFQQRLKKIDAEKAPKVEELKLPDLLPPRSGSSGGSSKDFDREQKKKEETKKREIELGNRILEQQSRAFVLLQEQDPLSRKLLELDFKKTDLLKEGAKAAAEQRAEIEATIKAVSNAEAAFAIGSALGENAISFSGKQGKVRSGFAEGASIDQEIQKANDQANIFKQTLTSIGDVLGNTIRSGIDGLINGTAKLNDVLSGVLKQIGSLLINAGFNALGNSGGGIGRVFSFLGFGDRRANGGPVRPGGTYLVGEKGPELLQMGSQGGFVQSNRSEAMRRYQSGGRGDSGSGTMTVNYNVTEINGMRFVTEDQFRAGLDEAAKNGANMGKTMTFNTLRNSRSQRSRIGL